MRLELRMCSARPGLRLRKTGLDARNGKGDDGKTARAKSEACSIVSSSESDIQKTTRDNKDKPNIELEKHS